MKWSLKFVFILVSGTNYYYRHPKPLDSIDKIEQFDVCLSTRDKTEQIDRLTTDLDRDSKKKVIKPHKI